MGKTPSGEESLFALHGRLLAPCLLPVPWELKDQVALSSFNGKEQKQRNPVLNFLVNPEAVQRIQSRSKVFQIINSQMISRLRSRLESQGFMEVETPILSAQAGGANARPFRTEMHALANVQLEMRIAPELFLKQLVIGGMEKERWILNARCLKLGNNSETKALMPLIIQNLRHVSSIKRTHLSQRQWSSLKI